MRRYYLSELAAADLRAIGESTFEISPSYSVRLMRKLVAKFNLIGRFPRIGTDVGHLKTNLRKTPVEDVIIFFRESPRGTEIVRVIHGARQIDKSDFAG